MTPNQFIEKAIEGGWDEKRAKVTKFDMRDGYEGIATSMQSTDRMFLDPKAWKAVGKVEAWKSDIDDRLFVEWHSKMHGMIDALIEGKTIEDYLKTL